MSFRSTVAAFTVMLAACQQTADAGPQPERIDLDEVGSGMPGADPSPDTSEGRWRVAEGGQGIDFAIPGQDPWLSLECHLGNEPAEFAIVRHAEALPGQKALFPFVGNGMRSRFFADAALAGGEWRWQAELPADDPQLDVFAGTRDFTATLPGHGMLEIRGSRMPGEFLDWCRKGGETVLPGSEPAAGESDAD